MNIKWNIAFIQKPKQNQPQTKQNQPQTNPKPTPCLSTPSLYPYGGFEQQSDKTYVKEQNAKPTQTNPQTNPSA